MTISLLHEYKFGKLCIRYLIDEGAHVSWEIAPTDIAAPKYYPPDDPNTFSLVQAKLREDSYDKNFSNGETMFNNATSRSIRFVSQIAEVRTTEIQIDTKLVDKHGNEYHHFVTWNPGSARIKTCTQFINKTKSVAKLDWLATFMLTGISPFFKHQPAGALSLVRYRSKWAMEGRLEQRPVEEYALEPSWKPSGLALERFGQNGTMPVRGFFPIIGIRDHIHHVTWMAELSAQASWQLNAARLGDRLLLFGGLPDHDNGHWQVMITPGDCYTTPIAYLTVAVGTILQASQGLQSEKKMTRLPRIYNEWATTWGRPNLALVKASLPKLKDHGFDDYIVDAGWYQSAVESDWETSHGDWQVDEHRFPGAFPALVETIHHAGLKAGIWYEFETVGKDSKAFQNTDQLVQREGQVVTTLKRRFWNLLYPQVKSYLQSHFADMIHRAGFDYVKVDYNDNIGVSMDAANVHGAEALERLTQCTLKWFQTLHQDNPGLVIENCSSGGHRLTPAYIESSDYSSFSDAHETQSIPIIAANELAVLPARQNLIWCVVHPDISIDELYFRLISTLLGVVDFSGDIRQLSDHQWHAIDAVFAFRNQVDALISGGMPFRLGPEVLSYHDPQGYQISGFSDQSTISNSHELLVLIFAMNMPEDTINVQLRLNPEWHLVADVGKKSIEATITDGRLRIQIPNHQRIARALWFQRK